MPSELIAVLGTLGGALLVALINFFSNRSVKNQEWRLTIARDQVLSRQKLYAEFLVEAQRLVPGSIAVGDSAAALYAHHRVSHNCDAVYSQHYHHLPLPHHQQHG